MAKLKTHNKPINTRQQAASDLHCGAQFCALIAQNWLLRSGRLLGRYAGEIEEFIALKRAFLFLVATYLEGRFNFELGYRPVLQLALLAQLKVVLASQEGRVHNTLHRRRQN